MTEFIPISQPALSKRERDYMIAAIDSGWISSLGEYILRFEAMYAASVGTKYALAVSNGTTALHLALEAYGIGPGDEVVVPDLTFVATANAVVHTGATPVLVDIEKESLGLDPTALEKAITSRTKAVIPVHLYGHPANMDAILKIARKKGIRVIEDAAEAHGARMGSMQVGSMGDCGVFSFYGNKIITTGEGGMITTNDSSFFEKAKRLRDHAMSPDKRYWHTDIGFNYRMTNVQAALGVAQLERLDEILSRRRQILDLYRARLQKIRGVNLNRHCAWATPVNWLVCLEYDSFDELSRSRFMSQLKERSVDSRPYFYPLSDMGLYPKAQTPVAHEVYKKGINLPTYFGMSDQQIQLVCDAVEQVLASH